VKNIAGVTMTKLRSLRRSIRTNGSSLGGVIGVLKTKIPPEIIEQAIIGWYGALSWEQVKKSSNENTLSLIRADATRALEAVETFLLNKGL
jgi:hypothetical protein